MKEQFQKEYMCEWEPPSKEFLRAVEIWEEYHRMCDGYDNIHCSGIGPSGKTGFPVDGYERGLTNRYARLRLSIANDKAREAGITTEEMEDARQYVLRRLR